MDKTRFRDIVFTAYKFGENYETYLEKISKSDKIAYICGQLEKCPTTGKLHIQGYCEIQNQLRMKTIKKIFNDPTLHIETRHGTQDEAIDYCKKIESSIGKFVEFGEKKEQGKRCDLEYIKETIFKEELSMDDVMLLYPFYYCKYRNGLRDIVNLAVKERSKKFRNLKVEVYYGSTGTGKTKKAVEENEHAYKINGDSLNWFDGYMGERTLIIDEYDSQSKCTELLGLLDGYQLRLPIKGGFTYALWEKVIITSNVDPNDWHSNAKKAHKEALNRRITDILKFSRNGLVEKKKIDSEVLFVPKELTESDEELDKYDNIVNGKFKDPMLKYYRKDVVCCRKY